MAVVAHKIILILQMAGAMVLITTGYLDRLDAIKQPTNMSYPFPYIALPVWTGALVSNSMSVCNLRLLAAGTSSKLLNMRI